MILLFGCQPSAEETGASDTDTDADTDSDTDTDTDTDTDSDTDTDVPRVAGDGGCWVEEGPPPEEGDATYYDYPVYISGTDRRFVSIQDGIWGAEEGDTVVVKAGTYLENIDFKGKAITVCSESGPWVTTIDGQELGSTVALRNWEGPESVLEGFTVTGGDGYEGHGGGVYVEWGSPTILHNVFVDNRAGIAGGVYVRNGAATVTNNIIVGNRALQGGGGFVCSACRGTFAYNTLYLNDAPDGPAAEYFWGVADFVGNILVVPDGSPFAIRWLDPREKIEWDSRYNLLWPDVPIVREGGDKPTWPSDEGWVFEDPLLVDPDGSDFSLGKGSPAIDAGPPDATDADGTRADLGAYGGPSGVWGAEASGG